MTNLNHPGGERPATIIELRQAGSGWGEIFKDTIGFAANRGYNLGLIVSGREAPAHLENLADFCETEIESLTELLQETGAKIEAAEEEGTTSNLPFSKKRTCG